VKDEAKQGDRRSRSGLTIDSRNQSIKVMRIVHDKLKTKVREFCFKSCVPLYPSES